MATLNYQLQRKNTLIAQAGKEFEYITGRHVAAYMSEAGRGFSSSSPLVFGKDYTREKMNGFSWYRLGGFRKSEYADEEKERGRWSASMMRLLQAGRQQNHTIAFLLEHDGRETRVFYGVAGGGHEVLGVARERGRGWASATGDRSYGISGAENCRMILENAGNDMEVMAVEDPLLLMRQAREGGIVLGNHGFNGFDSWDYILDAMQGTPCMILLVMKPVIEPVVNNLSGYYKQIINSYSDLKSISTVMGKGTQRVVSHPLEQVEELLRAARAKEMGLMRQAKAEGMFAVTMWFGTETKAQSERCGIQLASLMQWKRDHAYENSHQICFLDHGIGTERYPRSLWVPWANFREPGPGGINDLSDHMTLSDAAALLIPPQTQRPGYHVRATEKSSFDRNSFDVVQNMTGQRGRDAADAKIHLGQIEGSGMNYEIPVETLSRHCSISGKTGNGKTETSHTILVQLHEQGIPALILEPTKKEHWELIRYIPELNVYSAGGDGLPLKINPMEPEPGVTIGAHVNNLVRALESYVELESPLNEAFQGLFLMAYRRAGWEAGDVAGSKAKPYPTFKGAMALIVEYMETETCYSKKGEVHGNVRGALTMRLKALTQGTLESVTDCANGISMRELFEGPAVVELEDLGDSEKIFFMNLLMCRIFDYLKQQPTRHNMLKRMIVIEEAHNIFRESNDPRDRALNMYFDQMMSTVRASGTGIMVLDQRIGRLNQAVISNTAVRINHQIDIGEEIDAVAECMGIGEFQKKLLRDFAPGECVAKVSGQNSLCKVQVTRACDLGLKESGMNAYCVCCPRRSSCIGEEMSRRVEMLGTSCGMSIARDLESGYLRPGETVYRAKRIAERYFKDLETKKELICMCGAILSRYGSGNEKVERKIAGAILNN